jgi:hypothetical protein
MSKKKMKVLKEADLYIKGCGIVDLPCPMAAFGDGPIILQDQVILPYEKYNLMEDTIIRLLDHIDELKKSLLVLAKSYEEIKDGYDTMQNNLETMLDNPKG